MHLCIPRNIKTAPTKRKETQPISVYRRAVPADNFGTGCRVGFVTHLISPGSLQGLNCQIPVCRADVLPSLSFRANEVSREIYTLSILFPVISAKRSLGYARDDSFVKILKLLEKRQFIGMIQKMSWWIYWCSASEKQKFS